MNIIHMVWFWYQAYFGVSGIGLLLAVALIWLWKRRRSSERAMALFGPALVLSCIIAFPLTAWVIMKAIGDQVYWRVFWMLPLAAVLAYTGVEWVSEAGTKGKKVLAAVLCVGLIAVNGRFVFGDSFFSVRENRYKLPSAVLRVADAINAHAEEIGVPRLKKKIAAPTSIAVYIRLYDASIRQQYGRQTMFQEWAQATIYNEVNSLTPDLDALIERTRVKKCRYVVLLQEADDRPKMEALGLRAIYDDPEYAVYFDTKFTPSQ